MNKATSKQIKIMAVAAVIGLTLSPTEQNAQAAQSSSAPTLQTQYEQWRKQLELKASAPGTPQPPTVSTGGSRQIKSPRTLKDVKRRRRTLQSEE